MTRAWWREAVWRRLTLAPPATWGRWGLVAGLGIVAAAGLLTMRQPEFGDGQAYMVPNALHMMETFDPFIEDEVHPPFYFMLEGIVFRIFGPRIEALHGLSLVFSLLAVAAVYGLGAGLAGAPVGGMAALLVAAWPPFLVQTTLVRLDIPVAAMSLLTVLAAHRGWAAVCVLAGSLAPLTKAPGVLSPGILAAMAAAGLWKPRFHKALLWIPLCVYAGWLVACKVRFGWFLYPENVEDFSLLRDPRAGLDGIAFWMRRLFIDQWAWVAFGGLVLADARKRPYLLALIGAGAGLGAVLPRFGTVDGVALGTGVAVAVIGWRAGGFWRIFPLLAAGIVAVFFTYHYRFPRYMLPGWPGLALLCARGLSGTRLGLGATGLTGIMMVWAAFSQGMWNMQDWSRHESTFAYRSTVQATKTAAEYLYREANDRAVVAEGKAAECLTVAALGYVQAPLKVVAVDAPCPTLRSAGFYFQISTRSKALEKAAGRRFAQCGVRTTTVMANSWPGPYGDGNTGVYLLEPGGPWSAARQRVNDGS